MKIVLSLDLSTKTGWAYYENKELISYGTIFLDKKAKDFGEYPLNFVSFADEIFKKITDKVDGFIIGSNESVVVIEETTSSKNNYSQKILEYIHYRIVNHYCDFTDVKYVRTGVWRKFVGAYQNADERKYNSKINRLKAKEKKAGRRKIAKIDGKITRALNRKDYALRAFKEIFGKELPYSMNDACDAALLGLAYIKGAPVCDGTVRGGIL